MKEVVCYKRSIMFAALTAIAVPMCLLLTPASVVAEYSPNGIDMWANDKLHLPDYAASTNLILNPSFEAGLRYWGYLCYGMSTIPLQYSNFATIDSNVAHSGSHSLRLRALNMRDPLGPGVFVIPVIKNTNYVLSFYAKASRATGVQLNIWGRGMTTYFMPGQIVYFWPNTQWQRYTIPINQAERFIDIHFEAQLTGPSQEGCIWVDDVQLELGTTATTFTQAPVAAQLTSAARGNFLEFGQSPNFNLVIHTLANTTGTVALSVEDFFYNNVFTGTYQFATNSAGDSTIPLDVLSNAISDSGLRGVFIVTGVFNVTGVSRAYTDYFRFSVMNFVGNTYKNKNLFNLTFCYQNQASGGEFARFLTRYRALGFGSFTYDFIRAGEDMAYDLDSERMQLAESYGFTCVGRPVMKIPVTSITEQQGLYGMYNINNMINPTDANLAKFANICSIKASARNYNDIWWFAGESQAGCQPLEGVPDAFAKFLIATNQGIKAGNPNAKVLIEGGPWCLNAESAGWVQRYIQDTKRINPNVQFDGAAAHHYRNFPENPDLDSDIAVFLAMLDNNGYGNLPFYINEGGCYPPFNIPQESISPYVWNSANAWYMEPLSYHSGQSERISAAFSARNWLVGLKYQNRVACMEDFTTPSRVTDVDFTSRFYEKIPNTLARLLGNASFIQDIPFAPNCRGYLFREDATGCPIAVVWGYKEAVDRWQEDPAKYTFDFGSQNVTFIDLMENEVTFPKDCSGRFIIPITPFPLFIKGTPGTDNQLVSALSNYGYPAGSPVTYMDATFHNGAFNAQSAGFWYNTPTAIPVGWTEITQYMYTTGTLWVQCGSTAEAVNNTGEIVHAGQAFTVSADLGGGTGIDAMVRVYATQNANGTGTKVLLASVHRLGLAGDGYTLFHVVGTPGSPASPSVDGYYVQVKIGGPYSDYGHTLAGYFDNIVVTATGATATACCGDTNHPYPLGDLNKDCYVNWQDVDKFADQWLVSCAGPGWCSGADMGKDAGVSLKDLAVIGTNWLACTDPNPPCNYNP